MTLNELFEAVKKNEKNIQYIWAIDQHNKWKGAELEYSDELLETEGDREVLDWAIVRTQYADVTVLRVELKERRKEVM
jgi:Ran GTPase-activating protein (RanGAP) involved in mRNA processing and transport